MNLQLSPLKKLILYPLVITAVLSVVCSFHSVYSQPKTTAVSASVPEKATFYATLLDGKVVIYKDGDTEPFITTDINSRKLPLEDQKLLGQGMILSDENAVNRFLEDYDS